MSTHYACSWELGIQADAEPRKTIGRGHLDALEGNLTLPPESFLLWLH